MTETSTSTLDRVGGDYETSGTDRDCCGVGRRRRGILAVDESTPTCNKRFDGLGIDSVEEKRRAYRQLLISGDDLSDYIGGAILFDETIRQSVNDGRAFPDYMTARGIIPGIKVDTGAKPLAGHPGELVTEGLDGLRDRLVDYYEIGARFAKWRAVITIEDGIPSRSCIEANAHALARYASLSQEAAIVPIVEPEVIMDGAHGIDMCYDATAETLASMFEQLDTQGVAFEGVILKPSMVISGLSNSSRAGTEQVAERTLRCLHDIVPTAVPGMAFLSGGQEDVEATEHLNMMNRLDTNLPRQLTFSYGRALRRAALATWNGRPENVDDAKAPLFRRARLNSLTARGQYTPDLEQAA